MKDNRYIPAGKLIRVNETKSFKEIFYILPKTTVAKDIGMKVDRFSEKMEDPGLFTVNELLKIATLLDVELIAVLNLVAVELAERPKGKKGK